MKKFFVAILALLYISTSTGATLHLHYCMGKLANWDLGHNTSKTCGKCGMEIGDENNNGCCKDEHKFLKNASDQKGIDISFLKTIVSPALTVPFVEIPDIVIFPALIEYPNSNSPPRSSSVAVYILNCTFLI
jgi:hypothetical protein